MMRRQQVTVHFRHLTKQVLLIAISNPVILPVKGDSIRNEGFETHGLPSVLSIENIMWDYSNPYDTLITLYLC